MARVTHLGYRYSSCELDVQRYWQPRSRSEHHPDIRLGMIQAEAVGITKTGQYPEAFNIFKVWLLATTGPWVEVVGVAAVGIIIERTHIICDLNTHSPSNTMMKLTPPNCLKVETLRIWVICYIDTITLESYTKQQSSEEVGAYADQHYIVKGHPTQLLIGLNFTSIGRKSPRPT